MSNHKYAYSVLVCTLVLGIWAAIPDYWFGGRTSLIYLDDNGKQHRTPLPVYIANAILPEEEVLNLGLKTIAVLPSGEIKFAGYRLGSKLVDDAREDFRKGRMQGFYDQYSWLGFDSPGSYAYCQAWNVLTGSNYDGMYLSCPLTVKTERTYPVVFFCHGYLGGWELYQGIFGRLDNCYVVSIGTRDLSGIFTYNDVNKIFTKYLPYLKAEGYNIDEQQLHLIGLSNGGSASNVALANFSNKFKSITFISSPCNVYSRSNAKVILVGGGKDNAAMGIPWSKRRLEQCGTKCSVMYDPEENHYMMIREVDEMIEFLYNEMEIS